MLTQRAWLVGLIGAATVLFVVGVSIERFDNHHGEGVSAEHAGEEDHEETLLGVDVEATPFIALAALVSLGLALGTWMRPRSAPLLIAVALAMLAVAVFDLREVFHQIEESEAGLAAVAGVVAALRLAASGVAFAMVGQLSRLDRRALSGSTATIRP